MFVVDVLTKVGIDQETSYCMFEVRSRQYFGLESMWKLVHVLPVSDDGDLTCLSSSSGLTAGFVLNETFI